MNKNNSGFSLVELLIAVAIMGILAAVGLTAFTGYIANARQKQAETGLSSIYLAQEENRAMFGGYFATAAVCAVATNSSVAINNQLFNGDDILNTESYIFCIEGVPGNTNATYTAHANIIGGGSNLTITNSNVRQRDGNNGW